jgi:archaellum component FlaC
MTDNEIIKAWDILCKLDFFNQRAGRELWNDKPEDIQNKDIEDFANDVQFLKDLINRQQEEIERLKKAYKQCAWERDVFAEDMKEEIKKDCSYLALDIKTIKAEAIKEFAERLRKHYDEYDDYDDIYVRHIRDDIDFTLDDMVGDKNEKDT